MTKRRTSPPSFGASFPLGAFLADLSGCRICVARLCKAAIRCVLMSASSLPDFSNTTAFGFTLPMHAAAASGSLRPATGHAAFCTITLSKSLSCGKSFTISGGTPSSGSPSAFCRIATRSTFL